LVNEWTTRRSNALIAKSFEQGSTTRRGSFGPPLISTWV
jgi:hypothetical protein